MGAADNHKRDVGQRVKLVPESREPLQTDASQRSGELQIVIRHESTAGLAPSALGKRDPILRCELGELRALNHQRRISAPSSKVRGTGSFPTYCLIRTKPRGSMTGPMSLRMTPATAIGGSTASIMASTPPKDVPTNMAEVISSAARTAERAASAT